MDVLSRLRPVEVVPIIVIGDADHLGRYLALESVIACGGSWMAPAVWIRAEQFDRIRQEAEQTARTVQALTAGDR